MYATSAAAVSSGDSSSSTLGFQRAASSRMADVNPASEMSVVVRRYAVENNQCASSSSSSSSSDGIYELDSTSTGEIGPTAYRKTAPHQRRSRPRRCVRACPTRVVGPSVLLTDSPPCAPTKTLTRWLRFEGHGGGKSLLRAPTTRLQYPTVPACFKKLTAFLSGIQLIPATSSTEDSRLPRGDGRTCGDGRWCPPRGLWTPHRTGGLRASCHVMRCECPDHMRVHRALPQTAVTTTQHVRRPQSQCQCQHAVSVQQRSDADVRLSARRAVAVCASAAERDTLPMHSESSVCILEAMRGVCESLGVPATDAERYAQVRYPLCP